MAQIKATQIKTLDEINKDLRMSLKKKAKFSKKMSLSRWTSLISVMMTLLTYMIGFKAKVSFFPKMMISRLN